MRLAEARQAGGDDALVSGAAIAEDLARHEAWVHAVTAACAPDGCSLRQAIEASRFLRTTSTWVAAMDRDGDGGVDRHEFLGSPRTSAHWLGTDGLGRDALVRLAHGFRMSLAVGAIAALAAAGMGVAYGAAAGLLGGAGGAAMMRLVDVLYGLPDRKDVPCDRGFACVQWLGMARTVRGLVASLKSAPWVEAARVQGCGPARLVAWHILPNARGPIATWAALLVPASIKEEAFLSFLGLGVQAPAASLGTLIADGAPRIAEAPWLVAAPALALFGLVLVVNLTADRG